MLVDSQHIRQAPFLMQTSGSDTRLMVFGSGKCADK